MLEMKVNTEYYNYFINGTKRIEIRINDEKRRSIKIGDKIRIIKNPEKDESFVAEVIGLLYYRNFSELLYDIDIELVADKEYTKERLMKVLDTFYTQEEQKEYGIVGIRLKY